MSSSSFLSWPNSPTISSIKLALPDQYSEDKAKKARHRHSPSQLAALNELYEKTEHPALHQRTGLAERLGMETKTVNAWFQNKRASTKKRSKADQRHDLQYLSSTSSSAVNTPNHPEIEDFPDGDSPLFENNPHSCLVVSLGDPQQSSFHRGHTHFLTEPDNMPRKMRVRPTTQQTDELKKLYNANPHPSREEREDLGERIGMRYQSITNWFQNQRSLAKKRKDDDGDAAVAPVHKSSKLQQSRDSRAFPAFPPPSSSSSTHLPLSSSHSSSTRARLSSSISPHASTFHADPSLSSRSSTPSRSKTSYPPLRTRRTRPEPYQLDALKDLFTRTSNPSIEERSALALEIGMDLGKVTNWFRNLRQTARKRARKGDGDEDSHPHSSYLSRSRTPSANSSSSSSSSTNDADDLMDLDEDDYDKRVHLAHSDVGSDDEGPEPPDPVIAFPHNHLRTGHSNPAAYANLDKASAAKYSHIKLDDALLLLSFHRHIVP